MSLNDVLPVGVALVGGVALGLLFFGGLWWTVKQIPKSRHPSLLLLGSFAVRTLTLLIGLVIISSGQPLLIGVAMLGFLAARMLLVRRQSRQMLEASHAVKP